MVSKKLKKDIRRFGERLIRIEATFLYLFSNNQNEIKQQNDFAKA